MGDSGSNTFAFLNVIAQGDLPGQLMGNIQGGGSSTLDYSNWSVAATVNLGNGTHGTASGLVGGTVSGITAIIGSNNAGGNSLNAGSVPDVALTGGIAGGLAANTLSGTGAGDSVVETLGSSYTLTDSQLLGPFDSSTGSATDIVDNLVGIRVANLVGNLGNGNAFNVSGWTGTGSLTVPAGSVGTVTAYKNADFILTNTLLQTSDGMSMTLNPAIDWIAALDVVTFAGHISSIDASGFSVGEADLTAYGAGNTILYGGAGSGTLTAAGSGDNILIGEGGDTKLTDTGTGRNILIGGGPGGDTLFGGRNDILVGGTTQYDSDSSANKSNLDAVLAEWTSSASYAQRIRTIGRGVRRMGPFRFIDALNRHTIQSDSVREYSLGREHPAVPDRQPCQCSRAPGHFASARPRSDSAPPQSSSAVPQLQLVRRGRPGHREEEAQRDQDCHLNSPCTETDAPARQARCVYRVSVTPGSGGVGTRGWLQD